MIETIRQLICKRFCTFEPQHPFTTLQHRSGQHLRSLLLMEYPDVNIRIADSDYSAPTLPDFETWIRADCISERKYYAEWHDCDDFARALRCAAFRVGQSLKTTLTVLYCEGYNPDDYHAFNMFIDDKDRIFIIEPQDDQVVLMEDSTYKPDFIQL